jgi:hypothetical protein
MAKKALISTAEPRYTGYRIAQVVNSQSETFEVSPEMFWVDCADDVVADQFWYNPDNQQIEVNLPEAPPTAEYNKNVAVTLLQETDWATIADLSDPNLSNPYLSNAQEFIDYRNIIRPYAINPVAGVINWPIQPQAVWVTV